MFAANRNATINLSRMLRDSAVYSEAMHALGITPVVDL